MKPLVSIIIPVYNAEKYLADALQSAIGQTWANKEIIVVDDGSTDNSLSLARQYAGDGVKVFQQENKGPSTARNLGLKHSKGDYIQFLDADDLLSANKIEAQMEVLKDFPGQLGLCTTVHFQDGENPYLVDIQHEWLSEGTDDPVDFLIKLYGGGMIGPQYGGMVQPNAWLTPKSLIDKAGPWNEMRCPDDDGEFFCRVILAGNGIKYAFDAVNYYRKFNNTGTWSSGKTYEASASILHATKLKSQYLLRATDNPLAKKVLSRLFWETGFVFYPIYKDLANEAVEQAQKLNPGVAYEPFNQGIKKTLSKIFGWKAVRYIQFLNAKRHK